MLALYFVHTCLRFSKPISWRYSRDCPFFGSMIVLENPIGMCDLGAGSWGGVLIGRFGPVSE